MSGNANEATAEAVRPEEVPAEQPEPSTSAPKAESEAPASAVPDTASPPGEEGDDDEEEVNDTCGFCIFMRGGGCRKAFNAWSKCVDKEREDGADFATRCGEQTLALRECMLQHRDYYAPLLDEEEEVARANEQAEKVLAEGERAGQQGASQNAEAENPEPEKREAEKQGAQAAE